MSLCGCVAADSGLSSRAAVDVAIDELDLQSPEHSQVGLKLTFEVTR